MGFTEEQNQAIKSNGANILVSAGAGSGKTTVLVARIINKIVNEKKDIDKLLVVTFTNAAASEMKERLLKALYEEIDKKPNDEHLIKQINLINQSHISTISSFCLDVIRNNFFEIGISANFRVGDPTEIEIIKQEAIEEVFENKYEEHNEDFLELIDLYTTYKDDQPLKELITNLFEYISSMPYPHKWLTEAVNEYNIPNCDFGETVWGEILIKKTKGIIDDMLLSLKMAIDMLHGETALEDCYNILKQDFEDLKSIDFTKWDNAYKQISSKEWDDWPRKRKYEVYEKELKDKSRKIREEVKKNFKDKVQKYFTYNSEEAIEDIREMHSVLKKLEKLLTEFEEEFSKRKKEKNIVDFSDIEHIALKLLTDEHGNQTHIAKQYEFDEILIDEYQDSNLLQETILKSLSNGKNIFMVGDVKQSIYRFRQAMPELFLKKYDEYELIETEGNLEKDTKIQLYKNFRSRSEVIDFTNIVFQNIMSKALGGIDYNKGEYLNKEGTFENPKIDCKPEMYIIETKDEDSIYKKEDTDENEFEILDNAVLQARMACKQIKELHKNGIEYKDIAVLLRSPNNVASIYEKELTDANIPVFSDATSEYLESIEVDTMMSLLKIIDNPLQDIPLVTVLRSPICGFDDNELVEIRLHQREGYYYNALLKASKEDNNLAKKINQFLEMIDKFRELEKVLPIDELIWKIYSDTGYYHYVRLMPNGKLRQANLRKIFEKAKDYEKISFKGLFNYISFIEKVASKKSSNMMSAKIIGENDDIVRIMSVHKSKGLEFPIVILCGVDKRFNEQDMTAKIIYDQNIGIGVNYLTDRMEYPTLAKIAINAKNKNDSVSEEMRILYVALTRAKEKLIIIATDKEVQKKIEQKRIDITKYHGKDKVHKLNSYLVGKYSRFIDWLELVYVNNENMDLKLNIIHKSELKKEEKVDEIEEINLKKEIDLNKYKEVDKLLNWKYKYNELVEVPSKTSVTSLKKCKLEFNEHDVILLEDTNIHIKEIKLENLESNKSNDLSPMEKGTLIHLVLQKMEDKDIEKTINSLNIGEDKKKFLKSNISMINNYIESNLFKELQNAKEIHKETPFYINIKYKNTGENVLVQGIIDLYYIDKNGDVILVDYKTDKNVQESILKERYFNQLSIYKMALKKSLNRPVKKTYIYSTFLNKLIEI